MQGFVALTFALAYLAIYLAPAVSAAALNTASITLGDPRTTTTSTYTVQASGFSTGTTINCIQLDVGTAVDGTGDAGLDLSSITLDSTTIPSAGSWTVGSVDGATDQLQATLVAGATPNASGNIVWGGVVNGATEGTTYFGLLETFANTDCSTGGAVDSVAMAFIYKNGELVSLTIDPSLTFTCAGVASGQEIYPVGGASLNKTVLSNASGIDHGATVNSTTNGISSHDLTTSTNASGGLNVYVRHTGLLENAATDTIADGSLSAASFPAPGTEAWAWTTDDDDVGSFNNAGTGLWTSFNTTNAVIASAPGSQASTTDRVGHQVGVAGDTAAGTYTTTIVYTAVAVY